MKLLTTIIVILSTFIDVYAQFDELLPKRALLKGYKKMTSSTYSDNKDSAYVCISYLNSSGEIIKSENFDKGRMNSWSRYEYTPEGLLKYEESHNEFFEYDKQAKGHVGKITNGTYYAKLFEYKGNQLVKELWIDAFEGNKKYSYAIEYFYDKFNRLIKELHLDHYSGPVVTFKPSTAIVDSTYTQDAETSFIRTFAYKQDSVIVTKYDSHNAIEGYSITRLNASKKPISVLLLDKSREPIEVATMKYDQNNNLILRRNRIIDERKIDYDRVAGDEFQIFYNKKKLPVRLLGKENGTVIYTTEIKYE